MTLPRPFRNINKTPDFISSRERERETERKGDRIINRLIAISVSLICGKGEPS